MPNDGQLKIELNKLEPFRLERLAKLWGSKTTSSKGTSIRYLLTTMSDIFRIRGVLEKLSMTQIQIYVKMLDSYPEILTLGQLAKFISMPVKNAEMELNVLKKYSLIYQRKNRERLTNNLDKCYAHLEIAQHLEIKQKSMISPLQFSLRNTKAVHTKEKTKKSDSSSESISSQKIEARISATTDKEKELLMECLKYGGILEINNLRHFFQLRNMPWEESAIRLLDLELLVDQHYILEKLIRLLIIPEEVSILLEKKPLLLLKNPTQKKKGQQAQKRWVCNHLDFPLNIKKLLLYISKRELGLGQSGNIKQVDFRETERILLAENINLFVEKSQIHQIELLLPIMSLLKMVRVKGDQIALKGEYDQIIGVSCMDLLYKTCDLLKKKPEHREKAEQVFRPQYIEYPSWDLMQECMDYLKESGETVHFILISSLIKKYIAKDQYSDFKSLQNKYVMLQEQLTSALFYLQLLGFIQVEFPSRMLNISELGEHIFYAQPLENRIESGGIILNSDLTLVAIPEKLSILGITLLKSFARLESLEDVYTFTLSKKSFQEGLLLKESKDALIDLLRKGSRQEISQNLTFEVDEWSAILPIVQITDDCVLVQTQKDADMKLLLNNIQSKKILVEALSEKAICIHSNKISELIQHCERLNLIVKLTK